MHNYKTNLLLMVFGLAASGKREAGESRVSSIVILLILTMQAFHSWPWLWRMHSEGIGYTSRSWQESNLPRKVKTLGPSNHVYSNAPDVLYILARRPAQMLPRKVNPDTRQENPIS